MYTIKNYLKLMLVFSAILFVSAVGLAGESVEEPPMFPVGEVNIGSNAIHWLPTVEYKSLVLSVSTPEGYVFRKTFGSSDAPFLELSDDKGNYLADGNYTYELRVIPAIGMKTRDDSKEFHSSKALTQSGSFEIRKGNFVLPSPSEAAANISKVQQGDDISKTMDVCYVDDLIVDGSLCVGFDCTCNYSFGFDTIVLKENNLRIFFDDTSAAGSFPRNDWRIVINDSASGGGSYFGVEDSTAGRRVFTLEAGAPSHSLYVDDGGRVGFGTATPVVDLHVVSGNTPTLRLEQDGSSGFAPQTFDVAANETNFFVRDATNGSTLPFRIQPDAPSNVLTIRADGRIGMGTWSPGFPVHLLTNSSTNAAIVAERTSGASTFMNSTATFGQFGTVTDHPTRILVNSSWKLQLNSDNSLSMASGATCTAAGVWTNASSKELKENIRSLTATDALNTLYGLNPVIYNYKVDKAEDYVGFLAEDAPELVATNDRKGMSPMDVVAVLTKVVQEQQESIKKQEQNISELKKEINELKKNSTNN